MQNATVSEVKKRLEHEDPFIFIDVREPWEYEEFNLGAKSMPLSTLMNTASELLDHKDDEIIVHCRSGARSVQAKMILESMGFTKVRNLTGGILAWQTQFG